MQWPKRKQPNGQREGRAPVAGQRSSVFSYYANTNKGERTARTPTDERKLRPSETVKLQGRREMLIKNLPLLVAMLAVLMGIIYNTTLTPNPQVIVNSVTESQTFLRDEATYRTALSEQFTSAWQNRSKLTINTQTIADDMITQFPELADVSVTLPLVGTRPVVQLEATRPAVLLSNGTNVYVLDDRGIVLMDAKDLKQSEKLIVIRDESGLAIENGKPALTADQVTYIKELQRQLAGKGLKVKEYVLPASAQQVDVFFEDWDYYGKFLFLTDSRVAAGGFIALQKDLQKRGITPRQYIDARLEERLYYK